MVLSIIVDRVGTIDTPLQRKPMELWLVDLEKCAGPLAAIERAIPRLSPEDVARASAISDARERQQRLTAYVALRVLIERAAGAGQRCVPFVRANGVKPRLPSGRPGFSLSHIDGHALVGISPALTIGVDLEQLRPVRLAPQRVGEIIAVGRGLGGDLPVGDPDRAFIQAWSRLEAFCKARGRGISQTLSDLGVRGRSHLLSPDQIETKTRSLLQDADVEVTDLAPLPDALGAAAAPRGASFTNARSFPVERTDIELLVASG